MAHVEAGTAWRGRADSEWWLEEPWGSVAEAMASRYVAVVRVGRGAASASRYVPVVWVGWGAAVVWSARARLEGALPSW